MVLAQEGVLGGGKENLGRGEQGSGVRGRGSRGGEVFEGGWGKRGFICPGGARRGLYWKGNA